MEKLTSNQYSSIKKMVAVASGKGGVGKSTVTALLACQLVKKGYKVGILDADITGPSIARMFNVESMAYVEDEMIIPNESENGIKIVSGNMLVPNPNAPIVWRAPIMNNVIRQFYTDVKWGELDYLLVDLPPGTGDIPLTVLQVYPLDGLLVVATGQGLVSMIVSKAINMAKSLQVPLLGVIENMSYIVCPDCGKKIDLFASDLDQLQGVEVLDKLPLEKETTLLADEGQIDQAATELPNTLAALEKLNA